MRALFLVATVCCGVGWAEEPKPVSDRAKKQVAEELVDKLGSGTFQEREDAEKKLTALGGVAVDVVRRGLKSKSAEVTARCERILPKLRAAELEREDHPLFKRFLSITGDTEATRKWYAEMLKSNERLDGLERVVADPKAVEEVYRTALDAKVAATPKLQRGVLGDFGWGGRVGAVPKPDPDVVYLFFLGSFAETTPVVPAVKPAERSWVYLSLTSHAFSGLNAQRADGRMIFHAHSEMVKLMTAWVGRRASDVLALKAVAMDAVMSEQPGFVPTAVAVLLDESLTPRDRGFLAEYIGRFGTPAEIPTLAKLFADDGEHWTRDVPATDEQASRRVTAQVGDVARAAAVQLLGHDPADVGFDHWNQPTVGSRKSRPEWARAGFVDDEQRKKAAATVDELLKMPVPKKATTPVRPISVWSSLTNLESKLPSEYVDAGPKMDPFWTQVRAVMALGYTNDDFAPVLVAAAKITSRSNSRPADAMTRKLVEWCLKYSRDGADRVTALRCLADITFRLIDTPLPEDRVFAVRRANTTKHLLDAYAELIPLSLPGKRPEVPKVKPLGPDATAKKRAEFAVANTARRDAQYVCDLFDARDAVVAQLADLYKPDSTKSGRDADGPDELKKLAEKKLPKEAVDVLMKQIK